MEPPGGRESRLNLNYNMDLVSGGWAPSTSLQPASPRHMTSNFSSHRGMKSTDSYDERGGLPSQTMGLVDGMVSDMPEDPYNSQLPPKKSPPSNGKKTKGRVKIKMEYIENKLRRYTTFSKRKTGIMKKAYELSTLTGTQVMLLVASETGHVYTFATRKLQPMITSDAGKALIQTCLNSPDPPAGSSSGDQRMSATGFEETELTYNISDEDSKDDNMSGGESTGESSDGEATEDIKEELSSNQSSNFPQKSSQQSQQHQQSSPTTSQGNPSSSISSPNSIKPSTTTSTVTSQPLTASSAGVVYHTPHGLMYAAPSNGNVIFGLARTDQNLPHGSQLLIPLSVMTANGQGELDLSKRK